MEPSSKEWILIYFIDLPYLPSSTDIAEKELWQKLIKLLPIKSLVFNVSRWTSFSSPAPLGATGAQGAMGTRCPAPGPVGLQGPALVSGENITATGSTINYTFPTTNGNAVISLIGGGGCAGAPQEKNQSTVAWQNLLKELQKGRDYNKILFGSSYSPLKFLMLCQVESNVNWEIPQDFEIAASFEEEISRWQKLISICRLTKNASFYFFRGLNTDFVCREEAEAAHQLELRENQPQIYFAATALHTVVNWFNQITSSNLPLPEFECHIQPFKTRVEYDASIQAEIVRRAQEKAAWNAKHRITGTIFIVEAACDVTDREGTCIRFIDEEHGECDVLLDYLIEEAKRRGFVFGNQRLG